MYVDFSVSAFIMHKVEFHSACFVNMYFRKEKSEVVEVWEPYCAADLFVTKDPT